MAHQLQLFRVRFFGWWGAVQEIEILAKDAIEAVRVAREAKWPPTAVAFRLIDTDGREIFEQAKAD